jgi:hypothetical protein
MKTIIVSIIALVLCSRNISFAQSNELQWDKFIKPHNNIEIIDDDYVDSRYSADTKIYLDSIVVLDPLNVQRAPSPVQGVDQFVLSIPYPLYCKASRFAGDVVLTATIDESGNSNDIEIKLSHIKETDAFGKIDFVQELKNGLFVDAALEAMKNAKFNPAIKNGEFTKTRVAIALSFVIIWKKNIQIDTIIVSTDDYIITLDKNGGVTYNGIYQVDKMGKWKSTFNPKEFVGITSLVFAIKFLKMKENFRLNPIINSYTEASSNLNPINKPHRTEPYISIVIKTKDLTKRVWTDCYMPIWEIAKLVDCLTENLKWEHIRE